MPGYDAEEDTTVTAAVPEDAEMDRLDQISMEDSIEPVEVLQVPPPAASLDPVEEPSQVARSRPDVAVRLEQALQQILREFDKPSAQREPMRATSYPKQLMQAVFDQYVEHFHPHWVLVHGPTYEYFEQPFESAAAVFLIGAFCWNQADKSLEMDQTPFFQIHGKLMAHYFQYLVGAPSSALETG